jgi:hypothetical protein
LREEVIRLEALLDATQRAARATARVSVASEQVERTAEEAIADVQRGGRDIVRTLVAEPQVREKAASEAHTEAAQRALDKYNESRRALVDLVHAVEECSRVGGTDTVTTAIATATNGCAAELAKLEEAERELTRARHSFSRAHYDLEKLVRGNEDASNAVFGGRVLALALELSGGRKKLVAARDLGAAQRITGALVSFPAGLDP